MADVTVSDEAGKGIAYAFILFLFALVLYVAVIKRKVAVPQFGPNGTLPSNPPQQPQPGPTGYNPYLLPGPNQSGLPQSGQSGGWGGGQIGELIAGVGSAAGSIAKAFIPSGGGTSGSGFVGGDGSPSPTSSDGGYYGGMTIPDDSQTGTVIDSSTGDAVDPGDYSNYDINFN